MSDYIPFADPEFDLWQDNLIAVVGANLTAWNIPNDNFVALTAYQNDWDTTYSKATVKQTRSTKDVRAKDDAKSVYIKEIRKFVMQFLSNNELITDSDREGMGLHVKSDTRTRVPVPTTMPQGSVDFSVKLQHIITVVDTTTPTRRAKPQGVYGCEIWSKIDGDAPKDVSELSYMATATRSNKTLNFESNKSGKTVYYWLRWVNTRQQVGPWSPMISAIIG